ncbi:MAG: hypothetical protein ISQ32_05420 [Rickettsiales bacterium]|nr:hypothetical protein [Rickettsiales bacterium]
MANTFKVLGVYFPATFIPSILGPKKNIIAETEKNIIAETDFVKLLETKSESKKSQSELPIIDDSVVEPNTSLDLENELIQKFVSDATQKNGYFFVDDSQYMVIRREKKGFSFTIVDLDKPPKKQELSLATLQEFAKEHKLEVLQPVEASKTVEIEKAINQAVDFTKDAEAKLEAEKIQSEAKKSQSEIFQNKNITPLYNKIKDVIKNGLEIDSNKPYMKFKGEDLIVTSYEKVQGGVMKTKAIFDSTNPEHLRTFNIFKEEIEREIQNVSQKNSDLRSSEEVSWVNKVTEEDKDKDKGRGI